MYEKITPADVEEVRAADYYPTVDAAEGEAPSDRFLRPIGDALGATELRPNLWRLAAGEAGMPHRHDHQEELYYLLEGDLVVEFDADEVRLAPGDALVVSPGTWRRLRATAESRVLVVGAPNEPDDDEIRTPEETEKGGTTTRGG